MRVGLIGYGYWGPNLFRNFQVSPHFEVVAVAEARQARRDELRRQYPDLKLCETGEEIVAASDIDAVVIATPVATHFPLASRAMKAGKHVLVEKPMCASVAEGEELVAIAKSHKVTLMVDHTFLFTGAVSAMHKLCQSGEMGKISYYDSTRINLGLFQPDVNVMWDLAPHDFSIMDYLLGEEPVCVEASGYCHINPGLPDIAYLTMHFPSDMIAHFNLSWMSPVKMRRTAIGGSKKMLVWDDLNPEEKIKIYNSGIELRPEAQRNILIPGYRIGDVFSPRLDRREALAGVVDHFAATISGKVTPIMGGDAGLRVVRMLEMAQQSLDRNLGVAKGRSA
jgi:predicted dehydrogenase